MKFFVRTVFLILSIFYIHAHAFAADKSVNPSAEDIKHAQLISRVSISVLEYTLTHMPEPEKISDKIKLDMENQFSQSLLERFSASELDKIYSLYQKIGAENVVKIADVFMQSFQNVLQNATQMKDKQIVLNIAPSYDALLEKKFADAKLEDKLKSYYIQDESKKGVAGRNLSEEAKKFATQGKNALKKVLAENFSEEQYRSYYELEDSELGKRLSDTFEETVAKVVSKQS